MEKVIQLLYDIEEKANLIVKRVSDEKKRLNTIYEQEIERFNKEITKERNDKLDVLKSQVEKDLDKERTALLDDCNKQLISLETYYKNSHDDLVDQIFQKIISN